MEGAFREVQNTGRYRAHRRGKTLRGLIPHVIVQVTLHTRKLLLRYGAGMDVQTCTVPTQFHIRRITVNLKPNANVEPGTGSGSVYSRCGIGAVYDVANL